MNIVFGTKRLGKVDGAYESFQKYTDRAVVTLEGDRGKGRTRRILFNKTAMEQMNLEKGSVQEIVFGTIDADENGNRAILIANANNLANIDDLTTYKTSKNPVSFDNTKEKGKAISSAALTKEMISFLDLDENTEVEYALQPFDVEGGLPSDTFKFVPVDVPVEETVTDTVTDTVADVTEVVEETENEVDMSFLRRTESEPVVE
jgi:hypothetical protein